MSKTVNPSSKQLLIFWSSANQKMEPPKCISKTDELYHNPDFWHNVQFQRSTDYEASHLTWNHFICLDHFLICFLVLSTKLSPLSLSFAMSCSGLTPLLHLPRVVSCTRNKLGFNSKKQKNGLSNIPVIQKGTFVQMLQEESVYFSTNEVLLE